MVCGAQTIGDYRSTTSGNWASSATWQSYNGTTWVAASSYPGQSAGNYAVTIQSGNTVTIPNTGITTQHIGTIYIHGTLSLQGDNSGVLFTLNTDKLIVTPNLTPKATIYFDKKVTLKLLTDAVLKVWDGGLSWDNCNNVKEIQIGAVRYANCNGAPGSIFTFSELMDGGGTLDAISTIPPMSCQATAIQLFGDYQGAIGTAVNYQWNSSGPAQLTFLPSSTSQNPTVTPTLAGSYQIQLTVSTNKGGIIYSNTERTTLVIAPTSTTINAAICQGDSYSFDGKTYNTAGTYASDLHKSILTGCDSTAYLVLSVIANSNTIIRDTICEGETYVYNGVSYQTEGDYPVATSAGCTNTILSLKVKKASQASLTDSICSGNSYSFHGSTYTSAGTYTAHLTNAVGCDSIVTLNLIVKPLPTVTNASLVQTVCSGTSTTLVNLTSDVASTTFEWTATADSGITGFTTNGINTIPAQVLTNSNSATAGTVTYVITPKANGCTGPPVNYVVTVTPKPITSSIYHQ